MLEDDYTSRFGELIESIEWEIELPRDWADYFDQRGEVASYDDDERQNRRLKIRTYGAIWCERTLPFCTRGDSPIGVYSRDFSRTGLSFLSPTQMFPEEIVRLVLPAFWVRVSRLIAR